MFQELEYEILRFVLILLLSAFAGLITFGIFFFNKLKFVVNYNHFFTFLLLPPITAAITKVIAGNLALSLGMVGALSIVRFRNPVRSPLELSVYFFLITTGIVFNVNIKFGIIFITCIYLLILFGNLLIKFLNRYKKNLFDDQNSKIIEAVFLNQVKDLEDDKNLIFTSKNQSDNGIIHYTYRVKIVDKNSLQKIISKEPLSYNFFNDSD
ncbi:hypothetical protein [Candidatus Pelagibacter sp. HIMB1509]|uniref:hypothetical protein n=1 Tax=Candidatus Pelagibacter sp. HIMB1509 TaxID=3413339 RepID=UPI003F83D00F